MTNLEHLIQEEYGKVGFVAQNRICRGFFKYPLIYGWVGDFDGIEESREKAIEKEIEWLKEQRKA